MINAMKMLNFLSVYDNAMWYSAICQHILVAKCIALNIEVDVKLMAVKSWRPNCCHKFSYYMT